MSYKGLLWPLRRNSQGDFVTGDASEVTKSDLRTIFGTRRYLSPESGGERVMRPGAFCQLPLSLIEPFEPELLEPLLQAYLEEGLAFLVNEGRINVLDIRIAFSYARGEVAIEIDYEVIETNFRGTYSFEIATESISETRS